jgi:hypothetical protein
VSFAETLEQLRLISAALEAGAVRLREAGTLPRLSAAMEGAVEGLRAFPVTPETVAPRLRIMARQLDPWALGPRSALTVAVACMGMAADHAEQGGGMVTGEVVAASIREFVDGLVA